jgi:hypothetical protein
MSGAIQSTPYVQTSDRSVNQLQQNIIQTLNQIVKNPLINGGLILQKQNLVSGNNTIAHGLGRTLQGWFVVRYRGGWADIFDNQDSNNNAGSTLVLNSSADVTVDVYVF